MSTTTVAQLVSAFTAYVTNDAPENQTAYLDLLSRTSPDIFHEFKVTWLSGSYDGLQESNTYTGVARMLRLLCSAPKMKFTRGADGEIIDTQIIITTAGHQDIMREIFSSWAFPREYRKLAKAFVASLEYSDSSSGEPDNDYSEETNRIPALSEIQKNIIALYVCVKYLECNGDIRGLVLRRLA